MEKIDRRSFLRLCGVAAIAPAALIKNQYDPEDIGIDLFFPKGIWSPPPPRKIKITAVIYNPIIYDTYGDEENSRMDAFLKRNSNVEISFVTKTSETLVRGELIDLEGTNLRLNGTYRIVRIENLSEDD